MIPVMVQVDFASKKINKEIIIFRTTLLKQRNEHRTIIIGRELYYNPSREYRSGPLSRKTRYYSRLFVRLQC